MAQQPDLPGPTTSYSDPIYDRLETVAQRVTKRLWLILAALVVIIVVAVVTHAALRDTPIAASAGKFLEASSTKQESERARDPAERGSKLAAAAKSFTAVGTDESVTPYYRARAYIELTQIELDRSALSEAKTAVEKARTVAAKAEDPDLDLAIGLSEAAVLLQAGDAAGAEKRYLAVERGAGVAFPDRQIAATLGAAQALVAQQKFDDAITKLEPLANRSDSNAGMLLSLAKNQYWALKRRQAAGPQPAPAPAAQPATTPATPEAPVAAPNPAATVPTPPAAPAPAVQALPAAPTATPSPEGK